MSDKPLTDVAFSSFDLHPALLAGLEAAGFNRCTPIQALTLPVALAGRDVAGQAQTGTGKTLAFLIAAINRLLTRPAMAERQPEDPRALILAPTRELAIQIHKDAVKFASDLGLKFALVYGGVDYDKQREQLQRGADIIIATPGRLIDYVKQHKVVSLHACEVCILDEADRMFDLGFIKDIRFLLRRMPARTERQTLLFSATLSHRVLELAYEHMNDPEKLVVETESITAARVRQRLYYPADEEKIPLLIGLLSRSEGARTMVFVNTKAFVERVARALEKAGYRVGVLSGDVPQKKRESLLKKFQAGQLEILVATDVAARGLHIDGVSHVYNYDLPFDAEDYVHRIGRTARLGAEGDAISFACERYGMSLPDIEAYIDQKIPGEHVTPDMLVALPRPERPRPEVVAGEEDDSIGTIFKEAREARAADEAKRGGGRSRSGGSDGGRRGEGGRVSNSPRPPRAPRPEQQASKPAVSVAAAEVDPDKAPRKRRRRRNGRPLDGSAAPQQDAATQRAPRRDNARHEHAAPKPAAEQAKPGLLGRIGQSLRRLVTRGASQQH
ncbi:MAG: ATP-dependent RNA helicase RhlB [Xanthomonadales bacterium]|nr:ATP-dependent RNA helicase RhlB [Xanthomonadales bacterium]